MVEFIPSTATELKDYVRFAKIEKGAEALFKNCVAFAKIEQAAREKRKSFEGALKLLLDDAAPVVLDDGSTIELVAGEIVVTPPVPVVPRRKRA
jgi:hypothetical protein